LSSTNNNSAGRPRLRGTESAILSSLLPSPDAERESGAGARRGLDRHSTAETLHYLLADRQTHACPGILSGRVQSFERLEDAGMVLRINPNPVVRNRKHPFIRRRRYRYVNFGRPPWGNILDRIGDQVLENAREANRGHPDSR